MYRTLINDEPNPNRVKVSSKAYIKKKKKFQIHLPIQAYNKMHIFFEKH